MPADHARDVHRAAPDDDLCPPVRSPTTAAASATTTTTAAIQVASPVTIDALLQLHPAPVEHRFWRSALRSTVATDALIGAVLTLLLHVWSPHHTPAPLLYHTFTLLQLSHLTAPPSGPPAVARFLALATHVASAAASVAYARHAAASPLLNTARDPLPVLAALVLLQAPLSVSLFPALSAPAGFLRTLPRYLCSLAISIAHLLLPAARALTHPAAHEATLALFRRAGHLWALLQSAVMGVPIQHPPRAACPPLVLALTAQIFACLALPATLHYFLERHRKRRFIVAHLHGQQPPSSSAAPPPPAHLPQPAVPLPPPAPPAPCAPLCLFLTDPPSSAILAYFPGILTDTYATAHLLPPRAAPSPAHPPGLALLASTHLSFLHQLPLLAASLLLSFLASALAAVAATRLAEELAGGRLLALQACAAPLPA